MKNSAKIFQREEIVVQGERAMRAFGKELAGALEAGDVLGLVGELGAGKTRLVQGILEGLGGKQVGASPTFSIVHEHLDGRLPTAHFDFYRLRQPEDALQIGWDEYLTSGMVLLVEWADRFGGELLPEETVWVHIERVGETTRRVWIKATALR